MIPKFGFSTDKVVIREDINIMHYFRSKLSLWHQNETIVILYSKSIGTLEINKKITEGISFEIFV